MMSFLKRKRENFAKYDSKPSFFNILSKLALNILSIFSFLKKVKFNESIKDKENTLSEVATEVTSEILQYLTAEEQFRFAKTNTDYWKGYALLADNSRNNSFAVRRAYNKATTADEKMGVSTELKLIEESHPPKFLEQMGGYNGIFRIPVMNIGNKMGPTDYLDFYVKITTPVRGFDMYSRPFYFTTANVKDRETAFKVFQRHTDRKLWIQAKNGSRSDNSGADILSAMSEGCNRGSSANGDDRSGLGLRGLEFFSRVFNQKDAHRHIELGAGYTEEGKDNPITYHGGPI